MKYEFVYKRNHDWSFEELKVISDTVTFIGNPMAGSPVTEIGRYLSRITGVKYLMIGRLVAPKNDKVETVCFFNGTQQLDNITYSLKNTPCFGVFTHQVCYYPFGVQEEFPEDADLVIMGVHSYMGTALNNNAGKPVGLIVLLHDKSIDNPGLIDYLLTIVSPTLEENLPT